MHLKFVKLFLISCLAGLGFIFFLGILVDPFAIYHTSPIPGFNLEKVEKLTHLRLFYAYELIHVKPKFIVLGSSRSGNLDLDDLNKNTGLTFFNCSIQGVSFDEIYAYFLHAFHVQPQLQSVIIGIDLFSFNKHRTCRQDFKAERLQVDFFYPKDVYETIFTWPALSACFNTIKINRAHSANAGLSNEQMPLENKLIKDIKMLKPMFNNNEEYKDYEISENMLSKFKELVEICKKNHIELKLFISPVKAMYWESYYQNSLWPALTQLKREISSVHPLWDFSGYTPLTSETMYCEGKQLYFECSHYTPFGSQKILKQMFEGPEKSELGCLLTPNTIDSHLAKILEDRQKWLQGPGKDIDVKFDISKDEIVQ